MAYWGPFWFAQHCLHQYRNIDENLLEMETLMSENNFIFCVFRLASISERRVKQDQRKVEDTLSSNRQSDLEKDFSSFFDEERLDACDKMLSIFQKEEDEFNYIHYPRLACIILEVLKSGSQMLINKFSGN